MYSPKKLSLQKDTIRALSGAEMQRVIGGVNYVLIGAANAATGTGGVSTKSCSTCGCPAANFAMAHILPAFNHLRAF